MKRSELCYFIYLLLTPIAPLFYSINNNCSRSFALNLTTPVVLEWGRWEVNSLRQPLRLSAAHRALAKIKSLLKFREKGPQTFISYELSWHPSKNYYRLISRRSPPSGSNLVVFTFALSIKDPHARILLVISPGSFYSFPRKFAECLKRSLQTNTWARRA